MTPEQYDKFLYEAEDQYYLKQHPDVAKAVKEGQFPNGKAHFDQFGQSEKREWTSFHMHRLNESLDGKHAIFITTYASAKGKDRVSQRLPETIRTLLASGYKGDIWVIDDGSDHPLHLTNLSRLPSQIKIIRHKERGGISRAKNSCILAFQREGYKLGFLSDDDNNFCFGWWEAYISAYQNTGIQHLCWSFPNAHKEPLIKLGFPLTHYQIGRATILSGILMTITPEIVTKVGGFKVLPSPWGFEHLDFTERIIKEKIIPFPCDVLESNRYLRPNVYAGYSSSPIEEHIYGYHNNPIAAAKTTSIYVKPVGGVL